MFESTENHYALDIHFHILQVLKTVSYNEHYSTVISTDIELDWHLFLRKLKSTTTKDLAEHKQTNKPKSLGFGISEQVKYSFLFSVKSVKVLQWSSSSGAMMRICRPQKQVSGDLTKISRFRSLELL
jgi:hypothetical protein